MNAQLPGHLPPIMASGGSCALNNQPDSYPKTELHGEEIMGFRKITFRADASDSKNSETNNDNRQSRGMNQAPYSHGTHLARQSHSASPQVSFIQSSSPGPAPNVVQPYNVSTIISSKSSLPNFPYERSRPEEGVSHEEKKYGLSQPNNSNDNDADIKTPVTPPMDQPYNMAVSSLPNLATLPNSIKEKSAINENTQPNRPQSAPATPKEQKPRVLCEVEKFVSQNWTILLDQKPGMPGFLTSFLYVEISKRQLKDDADRGFEMLNCICSQLFEPNQSYLFFCSTLSLYQNMIYDQELLDKSKKLLQTSFDKMISIYIRVYSQTLPLLINNESNSPDFVFYFNKIKGTIPRFSGDSGKYATHEIDNNIDCYLVNDFLKKPSHDKMSTVLERCKKIKQIFASLHFEMRRYSELIAIISNYKKIMLAPSMIPAIAPMFPPKAVAVCFNQFPQDIAPADLLALVTKMNIKEALTPVADFFFPEFHEFPKKCNEFVFC